MNSANEHNNDHKMDGHTCKNDVKLLFYIFNTFGAVGTGLLLFSSGIVTGVYKKMEISDIWNLVVGLVYILVGCFGYYVATVENKKGLEKYTTAMGLKSMVNVIELVIQSKVTATGSGTCADGVAPDVKLTAMIVDTIVVMVTMLLSLTLAVKAPMSIKAAKAKAPKSTKAADADKQAVVPTKPLV